MEREKKIKRQRVHSSFLFLGLLGSARYEESNGRNAGNSAALRHYGNAKVRGQLFLEFVSADIGGRGLCAAKGIEGSRVGQRKRVCVKRSRVVRVLLPARHSKWVRAYVYRHICVGYSRVKTQLSCAVHLQRKSRPCWPIQGLACPWIVSFLH
jgi:hypothetical protein